MTDPASHISLTDLLARPADAPVVAAADVACLLAADGSVLWATGPGRALAARLDRPSRARLSALAASAPGAGREAIPVRAGGVGFSGRGHVLQRHDGGRAVLVQIAGRIPRAWGAAPERLAAAEMAGDGDAPANALKKLAGARPTLRFVWHTDAAGVIRSVSAALARALGGETVIGKTWAELAVGIAAAPELDARVRSGRAWSGLATTWRLDALGANIPVEFGGAPIRDAAGAPAGQRGYGLMRLDAAQAVAPPPRADAPVTDVPVADAPVADAPVTGAPVTGAAMAGAPVAGVARAGVSTARSQDAVFEAEARRVIRQPEEPAAEPAESELAQATSTAQETSTVQEASTAQDASTAQEPSTTRGPVAAEGPGSAQAADDGLSSIVARVASGGRLHEPALPLFPPLADAPPAEPGPAPSVRHADIRRKSGVGGLSHGERQTLRDIARALGARVSEDDVRRQASIIQASAIQEPEAPEGHASASASSAGPAAGADLTVSPDLARAGPATVDAVSIEPAPLASSVAAAGDGVVLTTPDAPAAPVTAPASQALTAEAARPSRAAAADKPADPAPVQALAGDVAHNLARDIERQLGKERAAIAQEARVEALRGLVQSMPVAALVSRDGVAVHANNAFLALSRHAGFGDVAGQRLGLLFPETALSSCFSGKGVLAGARGVRMPVELICAPAPWTDGEALLILALRDATAEVAARAAHLEDELAASAAREVELRGVLDTATDGVVLLDAHGRILSVNRSAEALFGYEQNQLVGEPLTRLLAPESHAVASDYLEGLRAGGVASLLNDGREVTGRVRQGGDCRLFMTLGKVGAGAGQRYCAVLRDVTAWKKTESELIEAKRQAEAANAQKSDFLARMSHEVRTPLGAMIGFAELMLEERFGPIENPRYREYVRDIHESGQYVISLVNDLLDLARIEAGKMELSFASVDLNAVLNSCVTLMQPQASKAHIVLRSSLETKLPPVVADERSMRQITLNVLGNALKFTDAGGQVILSSARMPGGEVVIRVRDTGIGMNEQEVVEALKPFRRLAHGRKTPGTGLGLPLTAALVEANRGALRITSTPGEGTLVEIVLPPSRVLAG